MKSKVSLIRCAGYSQPQVCEKVKEAVDALGGITAFVKPGSKVLVKPNVLMAKEPECGITTHPEVVRAVIKILHHNNCKVFVGDGPSVFGKQLGNIDRVYEVTGVAGVVKEEGAELVRFDKRRWRGKFPLTAWLDECEYLVNLPKFKTHDLTILTGAIKNLFGLIPGTFKTELHKNYFQPKEFSKMLVDIYQEVRPALTVVDGIVAMEGDGPATGGRLKQLNLLFAGSDCVALDSVMASIMGLEPSEVTSTKEAAARNLGEIDTDSIEILGESLKEVSGAPFLLPSTSIKRKLPKPVIQLAKKLIKYYPCVERGHCVRCAACIQACPKKVISMTDKGIVFDYSRCIACFCCQEACPHSAIRVKKSLVAKMMGL